MVTHSGFHVFPQRTYHKSLTFMSIYTKHKSKHF